MTRPLRAYCTARCRLAVAIHATLHAGIHKCDRGRDGIELSKTTYLDCPCPRLSSLNPSLCVTVWGVFMTS